MKKFLFLCTFFVFLCISSMASATPWVDTIDTNQYISSGGSYSYTHDITDGADGFIPLYDIALDYDLIIGLYDDNKGFDEYYTIEVAIINQPGIIGDGYYNFSYTDNEYGISILGLLEINLLGELDVTISSIFGDFCFDYSELVVTGINGEDLAPVPEPATMLLLGSGLFGLAGLRRKFKK